MEFIGEPRVGGDAGGERKEIAGDCDVVFAVWERVEILDKVN